MYPSISVPLEIVVSEQRTSVRFIHTRDLNLAISLSDVISKKFPIFSNRHSWQ